jgi:hypothetical protein
MAQAVSHQPLTAKARVRAGSAHVGVVVDRVALAQFFLRVLLFYPVILLPWLCMLIYHLGDEQ